MNDRMKENAVDMLNIMIERIKTAENDFQMDLRTYRAGGANFMLYYLDILTFEEHEEFDRRIFHPFE